MTILMQPINKIKLTKLRFAQNLAF